MATAETKAPRRKENEASRSADVSPTDAPRSSRQRRTTRQLDFFQAMSDFRQMFPTLEDDVIEAVLRANDGAVDATIDQLLTMTIDESASETAKEEAAVAACPDYTIHDTTVSVEDSPPSYSEAMRSQTSPVPTQSIWTTPIGHSPLPAVDVQSLCNNGDVNGPLNRPTSQTQQGNGFPSARSSTDSFRFHQLSSSDVGARQNTSVKKEYRNWNPPMLGNLPDDFLRLTVSESSNSAKSDSERLSTLTTTPVNVLSLTDVKPKVHRKSKPEKVTRSQSTKEGKDKEARLSKSKDKKSKTDKMSRSFSVAEESSSPVSGKISRSQSARTKERGSRFDPSKSSHSVIIETHDFSQNMLQERLKENERRRKRTSVEMDPELTQYLEDERLAIALQNSEFLQELRGNKDFMKTLERDGVKPSALEATPVPPLRPSDDVHQGYGDDGDKTLGAFPFSQPLPKDNDAELRKQLSGMGKASKKQLAALARKFFRRKKKTSKQILGEKLAPSMINLLEDEDEEEEEDDLQLDQRYNAEVPEIEPLPSSLIGVPGSQVSGRPAFNTENRTAYYDNRHVDIV